VDFALFAAVYLLTEIPLALPAIAVFRGHPRSLGTVTAAT
jgi:hypothetical protein